MITKQAVLYILQVLNTNTDFIGLVLPTCSEPGMRLKLKSQGVCIPGHILCSSSAFRLLPSFWMKVELT